MHKPVVWATILVSAVSMSFSALAGDAVKYNDYRSQFDAQKAAISAQSKGQWINGKQVPNEDAHAEGDVSEADTSNTRRVDRDPVQLQQPDYESRTPKIGYHSSGYKEVDRVGAPAE